jgi:ATP-dependent Lhr-like helicase
MPRSGEVVVVNATDPLNVVGVLVPGAAIPAVRTREVTYVDGLPDLPDRDLADAARLAG